MDPKINENAAPCIKSTEYTNHARKCFMTGEYCSQQNNIQKIRQKLHEKNEINAFVVMNFSRVSDIVYEARIRPFIERLHEYLYLNQETHKIACVPTGGQEELLKQLGVDTNELLQPLTVGTKELLHRLGEYDKKPLKQLTVDTNELLKLLDIDANKLLKRLDMDTNELSKLLDTDANELLKRLGVDTEKPLLEALKETTLTEALKKIDWHPVKKIHVHRADSNPVSNYIICNRICQQLQTADLIVVDVSVESANVFYEFGLATSFRKFILPICFSESFYEMSIPEKLEAAIRKKEKETTHNFNPDSALSDEAEHLRGLEKHIDCYPWRRKLFEHFGIRFQQYRNCYNKDGHLFSDENGSAYNGVSYLDYGIASSSALGFSDHQYSTFPYDADEIGKNLYEWLRKNYNCVGAYDYNTLVVYNMDTIMNEDQAGQCIVNFYKNITEPVHTEYCFCGDRVAILGQSNKMWDDPKDNKTGKQLLYGISDLIRIGMNNATYETERRQIKPEEYGDNDTGDLLKTHIRNRCIPLNPETPLYVRQYEKGIQQDLSTRFEKKPYLESAPIGDKSYFRFFCLFEIMLHTLRYVDEIVVDLSSNSIQSMFWLGIAHGHGVPTVTVRHEVSEKEKEFSGISESAKDRPIFDIGGFWTAVLRYNETESFYKQLSLIQQGIYQHSKLMLPEAELSVLEDDLLKEFQEPKPFLPPKQNNESVDHPSQESEFDENDPTNRKQQAESLVLESYYRDRFWRQMLRDNQLHLFARMNDVTVDRAPRLQVIKWDMDAVAELSNYLSKRTVIGEYRFDSLRANEYYGQNSEEEANKKIDRIENCIIIGSETKPFHAQNSEEALSLAEKINKEGSRARQMFKWVCQAHSKDNLEDKLFFIPCRGFGVTKDVNKNVPFVSMECIVCTHREKCHKENSLHSANNLPASVVFQIPNLTCCTSAAGNLKDYCLHLELNDDTTKDTTQTVTASFACTPTIETVCFMKEDDSDRILKQIFSSDIDFKLDGYVYTATNVFIKDPTLFKAIFSRYVICVDANCKLRLYVRIPSKSTPPQIEPFKLPAQLLFWRDRDKDGENIKYYTSLVGVSGPATKALTSVLVDRDQKMRILNIDKNDLKFEDRVPLNKLQHRIRKKFIAELKERMGNELNDPQKRALQYLNTTLYRYFLPFLSLADEKRLCNGLKTFMQLDDRLNAEHVKDDCAIIEKVLENMLQEFRGVDILYDVEVSQSKQNNSGDTDNRIITGIELHKDDSIKCLFVQSETKPEGASSDGK